jgi:hypothetical protein
MEEPYVLSDAERDHLMSAHARMVQMLAHDDPLRQAFARELRRTSASLEPVIDAQARKIFMNSNLPPHVARRRMKQMARTEKKKEKRKSSA